MHMSDSLKSDLWATRLKIVWLMFGAAYAAYPELCKCGCCTENWIKSIFLTFGSALILGILCHLLRFSARQHSDSLLLLPLIICIYFASDAFFKTEHIIGGVFYVMFSLMFLFLLWMPQRDELKARMTLTFLMMFVAIVVFSTSQLAVEFSLRALYGEVQCSNLAYNYFQIRPQVPGILAGMAAFLVLAMKTNSVFGDASPASVMKRHNIVIGVMLVILFGGTSYFFLERFPLGGYESYEVGLLIFAHVFSKSLMVLLVAKILTGASRWTDSSRKIIIVTALVIASFALLASYNAWIHDKALVNFETDRNGNFYDWLAVESTILTSLACSSSITCWILKSFCDKYGRHRFSAKESMGF